MGRGLLQARPEPQLGSCGSVRRFFEELNVELLFYEDDGDDGENRLGNECLLLVLLEIFGHGCHEQSYFPSVDQSECRRAERRPGKASDCSYTAGNGEIAVK
jgi:hypothetical protein